MPQWVTVLLTVFYVFWLFAVLGVLWIIWQKQVQRLQNLEQALINSSKMTAQAAENASQAACMLASKLQVVVGESVHD